MKIFLTIPSWTTPHGGLRVIMEWANRLTKWHEVYLYNLKPERPCDWFEIKPEVKICDIQALWECDCVIFTSPHDVHLFDMVLPHQKVFTFLQMMEHLFQPTNPAWLSDCKKFYTSPYPMFSISEWNMDWMQNKFGRTGELIYIGDGVNFDDFPIEHTEKDGTTVLIEGWQAGNPSKDRDNITHEVAAWLQKDGYKIVAYGAVRNVTDRRILFDYHCKPSIKLLNQLYSQATILIKATLYDARACAPMEAMSKGTVTARAIMHGDDDLIHGENCLKCGYDKDQLYRNAKELLTNHELRKRLANNCIEYVRKYNWDYWMGIINNRLIK